MRNLPNYLIPLFATAAFAWPAIAADAVPYPEGYRHWTHVKSMIINPGHALYDAFGGIHHLYANQKALEGYQAGGTFPDGSVIVFDLLETNDAEHAVLEGERKIVGVMVKNANAYQDTGGWGFEGFKGNSKTDRAVGADAATACFECHTSQANRDFVFSSWRK